MTLVLFDNQSVAGESTALYFQGGSMTVGLSGDLGSSAYVELYLSLDNSSFLPLLNEDQTIKRFSKKGVHLQLKGLPPCQIKAKLVNTPTSAISFVGYVVVGFKHNQG